MKKQCYVTGATGCVGRNLVDELILHDWDVIILHRKSSDLSRLKNCNVRFQEVDLNDLDSVRAAILPNINAIFHAAGNTSHWSAEKEQQWKDNVLATRNLVRVALEKKVQRFIFTSTGATRFFQETDERLAARMKIPYVRTKRQAELEVYAGIKQGLDAVILHPIIIVGAYDYNNYAQIFSNLKSGKVRTAFPGKISFCHAQDVALAHIQAYEKGKSCERYVLGGTHATWLEFFQKVAKIVGLNARIYAVPDCILKAASYVFVAVSFFTGKSPLLTPELVTLVKDEPDISYYDKRKTKEDLGYESRSMDTMIQDCYNWLVKEGRL